MANATRTDAGPLIRLQDYRPSDWLIDTVDLVVSLDARATRVVATLALRPNQAGTLGAPLRLDGEGLTLRAIAVDGEALAPERFVADDGGLTLPRPPEGAFRLTLETLIDPSANTALMGLYRSSGTYCTQCEAEGFRRITYFLDRPDVLSVYTTMIDAAKDEAPVLLGNGNRVDAGDLPGGRHFAVWHDPHPKPCYLFALVGGRLSRIEAPFTTRSGREVTLAIHVEEGEQKRAGYALDALARAMRFDEEAFGREYDLDVFNIVAVSDFNMGAMENKGLNIFNDKYILATPFTATDTDYQQIEAIIAHEYFHNWTGNRITCRDWFQLCLKEGLTVFRDQEFTAAQRSRAVKRIADVRLLRSQQFAEDSGPLAHPVRPGAYREINNFYTATVYEKGAELVRMLKTLIGDEAFAAGLALYFARCDGKAVTVEDFLACFTEASGRDLDRFARWYSQAGTPCVAARATYDAQARTLRLDLAQSTPPTPDQTEKEPLVIPIRLGLIGPTGGDMPLETTAGQILRGGLFVLEEASASLTFAEVAVRPTVSLLRGFSAPVHLEMEQSEEDMLVLLSHDTDAFNRWQAAQSYASRLMLRGVAAIARGEAPRFDGRFFDAMAAMLAQARQGGDPAFVAQFIALPSEADLAREIGRDIDPDAIGAARRALRQAMGKAMATALRETYEALRVEEPFRPDAAGAGRRALRNGVLDLYAAGQPEHGIALAGAQFEATATLTDRLGALTALLAHAGDAREAALTRFGEDYRDNPLVLDKWLAMQATIGEPSTLARVRALMAHPAFSLANPNRVRALIGSFAMANFSQFHRADGEGYAFVAEMALRLDATNPQVAARLLGAFRTWRALEAGRRAKAQSALRMVADQPGLSRDVADIATRALA